MRSDFFAFVWFGLFIYFIYVHLHLYVAYCDGWSADGESEHALPVQTDGWLRMLLWFRSTVDGLARAGMGLHSSSGKPVPSVRL